MLHRSNFRRGRSAFTMTEMMIVVAVIGLLAAMAIPSLQRARGQSLNVRFEADLRGAKDAFTQYSFDNRRYPPDGMPAEVPNGMADYLRRVDWTNNTTVGGQWDWDNGQFGFKAGVSVYRPTVPIAQMREVDTAIDDGNLSTGSFRSRSQGYIGIIEFY
jgi:prepilin-type N-terminal cleavage/methylation domain-containing protein